MAYSKEEAKSGIGKLVEDFKKNQARLRNEVEALIKDCRQFPIHQIDFSNKNEKSHHDQIVRLVDSMLALHKHKTKAEIRTEQEMIQRQIDATDREIDQLVYNLYGLTNEEISIVEKSV